MRYRKRLPDFSTGGRHRRFHNGGCTAENSGHNGVQLLRLGGLQVGGSAIDIFRGREPIWWGALALAFLLMLLLNPAGFIGGGQDDWHYLQAARCLREHGLCLPHNHWEARWPVVAPVALLTSALGESRFTVSIAPGIASLSAILLLALVGNRLFGRPVGWVSALLLLVTPAFSVQLTQPSVEAMELAFLFAGFLAILKWQTGRRLAWAFIAGLLFSLATQVRETAIVAVPFALGYIWLRPPQLRLADFAAAGIGFAIPFAIEFAWFAVATGDPFYRLKLSMAHTQIWSSELLRPIDREQSPFFNASNIANWRMEPGIHVYWAIDGFLNLFVDVVGGISIPVVTFALIFARRKIGAETSRQALTCWLVAIGYMACLIYALAIDPKPRMMLVPLSLTTTAMAVITLRLIEVGSALVSYSLWLASAIIGLSLHYSHQRTYFIERGAKHWIQQHPGQIEIEFTTRKYLSLVPSAQTLAGINADKPLLLIATTMPCRQWIGKSGLPSNSLSVLASQKNTAIQIPSIGGDLCLLQYRRHIASSLLAKAINRVRMEDYKLVQPNRRSDK